MSEKDRSEWCGGVGVVGVKKGLVVLIGLVRLVRPITVLVISLIIDYATGSLNISPVT